MEATDAHDPDAMLRRPFSEGAAMARLIIVEDNTELASLIASAAQSRGHTPLAVHTGHAALQALGAASFDCAIVDLLLPDMRGGEILDRLVEKRVPAIAV